MQYIVNMYDLATQERVCAPRIVEADTPQAATDIFERDCKRNGERTEGYMITASEYTERRDD